MSYRYVIEGGVSSSIASPFSIEPRAAARSRLPLLKPGPAGDTVQPIVWTMPEVNIDERLRSLLDEYGHILRRAIRHVAPRSSGLDLDDIEQEARLRVWRALSRKRILSRPESYLYRVAVTATLDAIRRLRARREEPLAAPEDDSAHDEARHDAATPEQAALRSEQITRVGEALAQLATNRRQAVKLHLQGFTPAEIGRLRDWTEAKARNLVYRGLGDLRALLEAGESADEVE